MQHYFIDKEHRKEDYFEFTENILGHSLIFKSCDSVFSKDCVDYGTKVLITAINENVEMYGDVLDIGCGYGAIGIALSRLFSDTKIDMCDINNTAVELSKYNAMSNHAKNIQNVFYSDAYINVKKDDYDFIVSNPPIKAGKENLKNILGGAYDHLKKGGSLIFVIKKKHGEDSIKKYLTSIFESVEIIKRDSGYYILRAVK